MARTLLATWGMLDYRFAAPLNNEVMPTLQWIEVATSFQIPSFHIIGLPGPEVAEAKERVRAAIESSGFEFPRRRVVLNLSPSNVRKHGTGSDLAMALAVLVDSREIRIRALPEAQRISAWGELGLSGEVKPTGRVLRAMHAAWSGGASLLVLARDELEAGREALCFLSDSGLIPGPPPMLLGAGSLREACEALASSSLPRESAHPHTERETAFQARSTVTGLLPLPSGLERIACAVAAGAHHLLLLGPRGMGKSHTLEWIAALWPERDPKSIVRARLLDELRAKGPVSQAPSGDVPIRRVGGQVRPAALLGSISESRLLPGEFSLADGGLLLADELPEWPRDARESLREPLERRRITLTRARGSTELPTDFTLVATGNLCPCGGVLPTLFPPTPGAGNEGMTPCRCPHGARLRYLERISGPVLDRIDLIHILVERGRLHQDADKLQPAAHRLSVLQERILRSRERSMAKWGGLPGRLNAPQLEELLLEQKEASEFLNALSAKSLRARHKILRVALTLADLDGAERPGTAHLSEASLLRTEPQG